MIGKEREVMFQGLYINLDHAEDRRKSMEKQLHATGLSKYIKRFPAVTAGDILNSPLLPGQVGCFRSHVNALKLALSAESADPTIIFEDDTIIPRNFGKLVNAALNALENDPWDIIFLNQVMDLSQYFRIKRFLQIKHNMGNIHHPDHNKFHLLPAIQNYSAGLACYMINYTSLAKVNLILQRKLESGPKKPIDTTIRELLHSKDIKGYVIFPFLCGLTVNNDSSIDQCFSTKDPTTTFAKLTNIFTSNQDLRHLPGGSRALGYEDAHLIAQLYEENFSKLNPIKKEDN